jgi:soluble lytic murein transglycosylase-like protein
MEWSMKPSSFVATTAQIGKWIGLAFYWTCLAGIILFVAVQCAYAEPVAARQYRNEVVREARLVWGLDAPVAVFGGQIEQESGWRPDVCSPYACGLTQFTPATAAWISDLYKLGRADVFNPSWAIRAMVRYDRLLFNQFAGDTERDRWSFALSGYNGGPGMLNREKRLCAMKNDCNAQVWVNNVAPMRVRATWAWRENRTYVETILGRRQHTYAGWGRTV